MFLQISVGKISPLCRYLQPVDVIQRVISAAPCDHNGSKGIQRFGEYHVFRSVCVHKDINHVALPGLHRIQSVLPFVRHTPDIDTEFDGNQPDVIRHHSLILPVPVYVTERRRAVVSAVNQRALFSIL